MIIDRNLEKWQDKIVYEWETGSSLLSHGQENWKRLVRTQRDYCGVMLDQSYAYVSDGTLPKFFDGGQGDIYRVPQRFHKELEASK